MMPLFSGDKNKYKPLTVDENTPETATVAGIDANDLQTNALISHEDNANSVLTETTAVYRDLDSIEETKLGVFSILVVCASAVGGILFGFDTAIISSCLLFIKEDLGHSLSSLEKEVITSVTSMTALVGSIAAGYLADILGRRNVLAICCVVFIVSSLEMGLAHSVVALVVGRAVVGVAVGGASMVVPVFISEVAPSNIRGRLLAVNSMSTTGGQLVAYIVANALKNTQNNWRISFLLSGVPPVLFLLVVKFIPESPRFSVIKNRLDDAELSLSKIYPYAEPQQVRDKIALIQTDINNSIQLYDKPFWEVIRSKKSTQNALLVGSILMAIQQCVGFNAFMYYSATIFKNLGFEDPIFASISIALTNFLFSLAPFFLLDRIGRRNTLLRTVWILGVALIIAAAISAFSDDFTSPDSGVSLANILTLLSIIVYVAGYASGLGTVPWSSVELLPLEARAIGGTIITCCNWLTNSVISLSYLTLLDRFSTTFTFGFFSIICIVSWVWIYKFYPDVNGIPLEEISKIFEHGVNLKLADELRQKSKAIRVSSFGV